MVHDSAFDSFLARLRANDNGAAAEVFHRYTRRLIGLARSQFDTWVGRKVDPEDVVQSVYKSFFVRAADGQFDLRDWDGLWALLAVITVRKCVNQVEYFRAQCRDPQREVSMNAAGPEDASWEVIGREPTPEAAAALTETIEHLLRGLEGGDREAVVLHLQGCTVPEISAQVGRSERTVHRTLDLVRKRLRRLQADATAEPNLTGDR